MQVHPVQPPLLSYAITIGIVAIVMALRFRRMGKMRSLNPRSLWIVPALYAVIAALMFILVPPNAPVALVAFGALVVGGGVGWVRGKMMHIHVDPESQVINQKASPAAMLFLLVLILARAGARGAAAQSASVSPAMLTDPLIAFALGMFTMTRLEMYLRAKRLLQEARSA